MSLFHLLTVVLTLGYRIITSDSVIGSRPIQSACSAPLLGFDSILKFKLMLAEDGSGKGAGLVAAIACRLKQKQKQQQRQQQQQQQQ